MKRREALRIWNNTLVQQTLTSSGVASNSCRHVSFGTKFTEIAYQLASPVFEQTHPYCAFSLYECEVCEQAAGVQSSAH